MTIPEKFYRRDKSHPIAQTVGQMKAILAELPDEILIKDSWGENIELIIFNYKKQDMHLGFREATR